MKIRKAVKKDLKEYFILRKEGLEDYSKLENELADVFIYLLDLANLLKISLFDSLHKKEKENDRRIWK